MLVGAAAHKNAAPASPWIWGKISSIEDVHACSKKAQRHCCALLRAAWIHGVEKNPMVKFAEQYG